MQFFSLRLCFLQQILALPAQRAGADGDGDGLTHRVQHIGIGILNGLQEAQLDCAVHRVLDVQRRDEQGMWPTLAQRRADVQVVGRQLVDAQGLAFADDPAQQALTGLDDLRDGGIGRCSQRADARVRARGVRHVHGAGLRAKVFDQNLEHAIGQARHRVFAHHCFRDACSRGPDPFVAAQTLLQQDVVTRHERGRPHDDEADAAVDLRDGAGNARG